MDYSRSVPLTSAGLVVFGATVSDKTLLVLAVGVVLGGGLLIRLLFRRRRSAIGE